MKTKTSYSMRLLFAATAFASVATAQEAAVAAKPAAMTPAETAAIPPASSTEEPWSFGLTVPLWAPQVDGNATLRGRTVDVDVSFNQLDQHLDESIALGFDAHKGKLGFYGDVSYMKFSWASPGALGLNQSGGLKFALANAGVSYLVIKTDEEKPFILSLNTGVRYWYTDNSINIAPPGGPSIFNASKTRSLYQGVIGFRASKYLTKKLHLDVSGDIGGFNISHDTDWSWSATGMASYDFTKVFTLSAGYKALGLDESDGNGTTKEGLDVVFHGFLVAARFNF